MKTLSIIQIKMAVSIVQVEAIWLTKWNSKENGFLKTHSYPFHFIYKDEKFP